MRSELLRWCFTAACTILLTTNAAYGEQWMTAHIPFPFRAGATASAPAGDYRIAPNYGNGLTLLHQAGSQTYFPILKQGSVPDWRDSRPRLVFRCGSAGCALAQIFTGSEGWQMPTPKLSSAEKERLAVVYLTPANAN